jgi:hypothetical protein
MLNCVIAKEVDLWNRGVLPRLLRRHQLQSPPATRLRAVAEDMRVYVLCDETQAG